MTLLILPSIVALAIKVWLFSVSRLALFRDNPFLAFFLCALFGLNLAELFLFSSKDQPDRALYIMMAYYVAAVLSAATYLILVINVIKHARFITRLIMVTALVMAIMVCIPDFFLSGAHSIGYTLTRTPGQYYVWLQTYLLITIFSAIIVSLYGSISTRDNLAKKRSLVILTGTAPMALITIAIIFAMIFDYRLNATVILSLMTSVTLIILIYAEKRYQLFKFLSYVPYTKEYLLRREITLLISDVIETIFEKDRKTDFKEIIAKFESSVIELAIEAANGNKTHAADLLHIGKATLHRKLSAR